MKRGQKRMVHLSLWASGQVASLTRDARLLYIGLITLGDDDGRFKGSPALLRSQIFPYDDDVKVADVSKWMSEIESKKLVTKYEIEGEPYYFHPKWEDYQYLRDDRRGESNIPAPTFDFAPMTVKSQTNVRHMSANPPAKLSKEKLSKENINTVGMDEGFVAFWDKYPRKVGKKAAWKAWQKIKWTSDLQVKIMTSLEGALKCDQWVKDAGRFIPHAATWLNGERWEDQLGPITKRNTKYDNIGTTVRS